MAKLEIIFVLLAVFYFGSIICDFSTNNGGIYVKVLTETGKVMIGYSENLTTDTYTVSFQLDKVTELNNASQTQITSGNTHQHTYTSFTNLTTFSNAATPTVDNISTVFFSAFINLQTNAAAKLQTDIYIFGGNGTITTKTGQSVPVNAGNVLVTTTLTWNFCGTGDICTYYYDNNGTNTSATNVGQYLDMAYTFTTASAFTLQTSNITNVRQYTIGGNSVLYLAEQYYDGNTTNATDFLNSSYPVLETKTVNLRYPAFLTSVSYAFVVDMGSDPGSTTGSGALPIERMSMLNLLCLLLAIVMAKSYI